MTVRNRGRGEQRRWYFDFTIRGKRYREAVPEARTKAEAAEAEMSARRQIFEGTYRAPKLGSQLFTEFVEQTYVPWAETNKRTAGKEKYIITQLCDVFRGKALRDVSPLSIEKMKHDLANSETKRGTARAPASVNMVLSIGSRIFTLAVDLDQAPSNPFRRVKKLAVDNCQFRYLTWDEEAQLIGVLVNPPVTLNPRSSRTGRAVSAHESTNLWRADTLSSYSCSRVQSKVAQRAHLRDAIPLAIGAGLRRREQTRLQVKHCDFQHGVIVVEHTKTKRVRYVPMNDDVREILRRRSHGKRSDEFLLVNPITKRPFLDFKTGFNAACREAGIHGLSWKALRHTFGTRLGEAGYNAFEIADLMGHSDVRTTMRYVHATDRRKHEAVQSTMLSRRATA